MESKITQKEIDSTNYDFGSAIEERSAFTPFEGRSDQIVPDLKTWPVELQNAFYRDALALVHDERGQNRVLAEVGLNPLQAESAGEGVWEGVISPNTMTIMALPGGTTNLDPTPGRLAAAYFGYGYGQDAALSYIPTHNAKVGESHPGVELVIEDGRIDTAAVRDALPDTPLSEFTLPDGRQAFHFVNMTTGSSGKARTAWLGKIRLALGSVGGNLSATMRDFRAKGSLDFGGENGEDYLQRLSEAGRPDLQDGARRLRADFQALTEEYRAQARGEQTQML